MTELRIGTRKAERIIAQMLRDEQGMRPADAEALAAGICRRLATAMPTNPSVNFYRIIPREPPYGADFATAVATKLAESKNGPETANQLWQLVYDQGQRLRVA